MTEELQLVNDIIFVICVIMYLTWMAVLISDKTEKQPKNAFDAKRLEDNLEIIDLLKKYVKENPSQRLGQALFNLGIINDMRASTLQLDRSIIHEEPWDTLERVQKTIKKYEMG